MTVKYLLKKCLAYKLIITKEVAMKKILVWVLLVAFVNLAGCYYTEQLVLSTYKFDE